MSERKNWSVGTSTCISRGLKENFLISVSESGIKNIEISEPYEVLKEIDFVNNPFPIKDICKKYGINIWSYHLPFSQDFDISILDEEKNKIIMDINTEMIKASGEIGIKVAVIHPSSEPIDDSERPKRMEKSIENLTVLCNAAKKSGLLLAVENLPRTCLGNCSFDMLTILNSVPDLMMCFDTNHCLMQENTDFLQDLYDNGMSGRIVTIHASDYDFINERHRLPGQGINDWNGIMTLLEKLDYNGVFMYESSQPAGTVTPKAIYENYKGLIK